MTNLDTNASIAIDPSTPFCAQTYFRGLRESGVRPYAQYARGKKGYGLLLDDGDANVRARPWHAWALQQDPDRTQESAYVNALLDKHQAPASEDHILVLKLGISDDDIEPQVVRVQRPTKA